MKQYRYKGSDIVEDNILIWIKNVTDGNILFSTEDRETCYKSEVKFLNRFDKIYDNEPKKDFVELMSDSLVTHGVKLILLDFFWGFVL